MSTATSRQAEPSKSVLRKRVELGTEMLELHRKAAKNFARMDALEIELKKLATDDGNFKLEVVGKGSVSVSAPKESEFKGNVPEIQTEHWLGLSEAKRKKLEEDGLVKVVPQWSSKFYGRVTVKLAA